MDQNNQIQNIPLYSIDKLVSKSDLAKRGLQDLGISKKKDNFTIIYVCQFCGRFINYSLTPCIFCGNFPQTNREVIIAHSLSSIYLETNSLLAISKYVKNNEDLEVVISDLRQIIDDVLNNADNYKHFAPLFSQAKYLNENYDSIKEKISQQIKRSKLFCPKCQQQICKASSPCIYCILNAQNNGENIASIKNTLSETEKWIIAIDNFLNFIENYCDRCKNHDSMEELFFISVYIINRLIEKNELPTNEIKNKWKGLLNQVQYFGSSQIQGAFKITNNFSQAEVEEDISPEAKLEIVLLNSNLNYILKS